MLNSFIKKFKYRLALVKEVPNFDLKVGFACNNNCIHCFTSKRGDNELSTLEIKNIIDSINTRSIITVTGGEPTIRKDILEILKYIKEKRHTIILQTNGRKFANKDFTKKIIKYIDVVLIPIHSQDEKLFDSITRINGSAIETFKAVQNILNTKKTFVMTQTVINKYNYNDLEKTFKFINAFKPRVDKMVLTFPHPVGNAKTRNEVPTYTEVYEEVQNVIKNYSKKIITHYIPLCYLYPHHKNITIQDRQELGNKTKKGIDYINNKWRFIEHGNQLSSKIKSVKCKECIFDNECPGIWREYFELYNVIDVKPVTR